MTEFLDLKKAEIPCGVLHDCRLLSVKQEKNRLIFTFEIEIFENNYQTDFYLKYKDFNRCDMVLEYRQDEDFSFSLLSSVDKYGKFQGLSLGVEEFVSMLNDSSCAFLDCTAGDYRFNLELFVNFYKSEKFKKYNKYTQCTAEFYGIKSVSWKWYNK